MIVREIQHIVEQWAPRELCWEGDNAGLQIGSPRQQVKKILIALDVSAEVIAEARKKHANLIISHHPLLFRPVTSLTSASRVPSLLLSLAAHRIALISAHTNLDFAQNGVSFALANRLGLKDIQVLVPQEGALNKVAVFVPRAYCTTVMQAMARSGAGIIGNYDACSFQVDGTGTFRGRKGSTPFVGKSGTLEEVQEVRLEMMVPSWNLASVLSAMKSVHPYEEVAYDIYPVKNQLSTHGMGAIGVLPRGKQLGDLLKHLQQSLAIPTLRYTGPKRARIERIAVCGGGGSQLLPQAIAAGADAFITADVKYHTFQEAEGRIALIDAGHFETEVPIVESLVAYLTSELRKRGTAIPVNASTSLSNPVHYFFT